MTHTYAFLEVTQSAYDEIRRKLYVAGYGPAFGENGEIDMHGIALIPEVVSTPSVAADTSTGASGQD